MDSGSSEAHKRMKVAEEERAIQRCHDDWLHLTVEAPIDPELPIIDPHHHLWDKHPSRFFVRRYMLDEIAEDCNSSGHNITKTVYIQSSSAGWSRLDGPDHLRPVTEVEVMQGIAAMADSGLYGPTRVCSGIVGTVDLLLDEAQVEEVLRAQMAAARNFRGVRFRGGAAEDIPFGDRRFLAGVQVVERLGLVLDINGPEKHPLDFDGVLGGIADLARAFPTLTIVVDHCGGALGPRCFDAEPSKKKSWEAGINKLKGCPNVVMKVGGLQMAVNGFPLGRDDRSEPLGSEALAALTKPYYEHVIRTFGAQRCMFESNFPVDRWGVGYGVLWNSFKRVAAELGLSSAEKRAIFHDTAARVYRL